MPGKAPANIRSLARQHDMKALKRLAELIDCEDPKVAIAACNAILDRGHGKPTQVIAGDEENPLEINLRLTTQDRARALAAFVAKTKIKK